MNLSVQNQTVKNVYEGNGSTTVFPFTFALNETDGEHVGVYVTNYDDVSEATTNFEINVGTKTVVYPKVGEPLEAGKKITIMREIPNEQELNLENLGPFFAEDIERELDREVMMIQQLAESVSRSVKIDPSSDVRPEDYLKKISDSVVAAANSAAEAATSERNAASSETAADESKTDAAKSAEEARAALEEAKAVAQVVGVAGEPYDPTKTYNSPDIVILPDGSAWRCLATSTGEYPAASSKWVAISMAQGETFEYDENGDLQPREYAQSSSMWQIDDDGNIMPTEVIRV